MTPLDLLHQWQQVEGGWYSLLAVVGMTPLILLQIFKPPR